MNERSKKVALAYRQGAHAGARAIWEIMQQEDEAILQMLEKFSIETAKEEELDKMAERIWPKYKWRKL